VSKGLINIETERQIKIQLLAELQKKRLTKAEFNRLIELIFGISYTSKVGYDNNPATLLTEKETTEKDIELLKRYELPYVILPIGENWENI